MKYLLLICLDPSIEVSPEEEANAGARTWTRRSKSCRSTRSRGSGR